MPRLPGSTAGSGMGSFLQGAGQEFQEKVVNVGGSLLSHKIGHDLDMKKLNTQIEARERENKRDEENKFFEIVAKYGGVQGIDAYIHGSTANEDPEIRQKDTEIDAIIHPLAEKRKTIARLGGQTRTGSLFERKAALEELKTVASDVSDPDLLKTIDYYLDKKDVDAMVFANELLELNKSYLSEDMYKNYELMVTKYPAALIRTLEARTTDARQRYQLLDSILKSSNRSMMMELGYTATEFESMDVEHKRLAKQVLPGRTNDDTPPPPPPPDDLPGFDTEEEAIKEFMMRDPAAGWITNKKYKEGQIPDWRDVNQFKGHTVGDDKMFDVSQRDGRWFVSSVGAKPPPPPPADDDDKTVGDEEPFARKKGRLETFIEGAVEPDEGRDSKLDQYATRKTWKDTSNPGSVLRFRYNKNEGSYQVKDATRSEVDVYGKKEWQSISKEQFHEIVKNLVQWGR